MQDIEVNQMLYFAAFLSLLALVNGALIASPVRHIPYALPKPTCPWPNKDPLELINDAVGLLLTVGKIDAALACCQILLQDYQDGKVKLTGKQY
jgi:hypothetical protein